MSPAEDPEDAPPAAIPAVAAPEGEGPTRFGLVALIGAPNAGKSTLLNRLVGAKLAIVTQKVQTTRSRLIGIALQGRTQIGFIDTPGLFQPKRRLDRAMVSAAWGGAAEADVVALLVDSARPDAVETTKPVLEKLRALKGTRILLLNKVDKIAKPRLLDLAVALGDMALFAQVFMISGETGSGTPQLLDWLAANLPEGPWLYEEDALTDMPMRLMAAEVTREKLLLNVHDEIPYGATVETEAWEERPDGSVRIAQVITVEREGHRGIVIGAGGQRLKVIGAQARADLIELVERPVHLALHVRVRGDWMEGRDWYQTWGLDHDA